MNKLTRIAVLLGVVAAMGVAGAAKAAPILQVVDLNQVVGGPGLEQFVASHLEGALPVPGIPISPPWVAGGPGLDPATGGTTGFESGYLSLSQSANVTFQFMGAGDSALVNLFKVNGVTLFQDGVTTPCTVGATDTVPTCGPTNQVSLFLNAGLIPFQFVTGSLAPVTLDNTVLGSNPNVTDGSAPPRYFLGVDPYVATGTFQTSGTVVYAGLSDLPMPDRDYQDMVVRISAVSEPESIFLLGVGLLGLAVGRRKFARSV